MRPKRAIAVSATELRFPRRAEADLSAIADYTIGAFEIEQARRYRDLFDACFNSLCANPKLGRSINDLAPGLRCIRGIDRP